MHELRRCPLTRRWAVIAPTRVRRPDVMRLVESVDPESFDPFGEGNEHATPHEILAYRHNGSHANGPGWSLRVVPNKFPALSVEGHLEASAVGLYDCLSGIGAHEVIIESAERETRMAALPVSQVTDVMRSYQDRLRDLKHDQRLVQPIIFKNAGALAGASLDHTHSQLIVLPIVPPDVENELNNTKTHYEQRGRDLFGDLLAQEMEDQVRIVTETASFVAYCPYASRFAFEIWVVPKVQQSNYEDASHRQLEELGGVMKEVLCRLDAALGEPPFNYVLHTAPFRGGSRKDYRWHFKIFPRLSRVAGFEWGSGAFINAVPPEDAAKFLRDVEIGG